jgi:CDP-diacylglycerol--glycerol-3-phosphate 3-phosphatidyltransferase
VIDALLGKRKDAFWEACARPLARLGATPDGVTLAAFALSLANSAAFVFHRDTLLYGVLLALTELLDDLDGALARVRGGGTRAGSFLDAASDRYKESASLLAVAWVTGYWGAGFLAVTGSLLVSYNHARAAMEGAPARASGTDLAERFERVALLVAGLVLQPFVPERALLGRDALYCALAAIALLSHATAARRLWRGYRTLRGAPPR